MLVNVGFATKELQDKIWDSLNRVAEDLGLTLNLLTQADSLYFSSQMTNVKALTLVAPEGDFPCEDFTPQSLKLVLCWHRERLMLENIRTHRHTLGNLIVIYLSRIMKLADKVEATENEALMKLHERLTLLYGEFEKINVVSSKKLP